MVKCLGAGKVPAYSQEEEHLKCNFEVRRNGGVG